MALTTLTKHRKSGVPQRGRARTKTGLAAELRLSTGGTGYGEEENNMFIVGITKLALLQRLSGTLLHVYSMLTKR